MYFPVMLYWPQEARKRFPCFIMRRNKHEPALLLCNTVDAVANYAFEMYEVLGGWERGEKQMHALVTREAREKIGCLIDKCKEADSKALSLLKELLMKL